MDGALESNDSEVEKSTWTVVLSPAETIFCVVVSANTKVLVDVTSGLFNLLVVNEVNESGTLVAEVASTVADELIPDVPDVSTCDVVSCSDVVH